MEFKMRMKLICLCIALLVVGVMGLSPHAEGTLTIYLSPKYIGTGDTRVIEVFDQRCNVTKGSFSITGGSGRAAVSICKSDAGYGSIRYRNVTNNGGWVASNLLSDGDEVTP